MKRLQFSISGLLALTFLLAIVLSLRGRLDSECSFETLWIAVFVLAYWKSPKAGWPQVFRAMGATAVIWGVLILCVYAWFLKRKGAPSAAELALHGAVLVLAAVVLAMAAACLVEGIRAGVRSWLRCRWPRRVVVALALVALISLVAVGGTALRPSYWEPVSVTWAGRPFQEGFPHPAGGREPPEVKDAWLVDASADGKFVAAILYGGQRLLVFDSASGDLLASFVTAGDESFNDLTFHPDGSALAALLYSKTAGPKLARWDIPGWTPREPIPLLQFVDGARPGERTCLSLDRCLLVVRALAVNEHTGKVEISTIDLLDEQLVPREFASADVQMTASPRRWALSGFVVPEAWIVSASGDSICMAGVCLSRADTALTRLPGTALGFFRDADSLAVRESSRAFYWKGERHAAVTPPFWSYLRVGARWRLSVYDCRRRKVIAQSRWFTDLREPRLSLDQSQLVAQQADSVLIWKFPASRVRANAPL